MWSETFFLNVKDILKHFSSKLSSTEVEYVLYQELKNDNYKQVVKFFKSRPDLPFPAVELAECSIFNKMSVLLKNYAI